MPCRCANRRFRIRPASCSCLLRPACASSDRAALLCQLQAPTPQPSSPLGATKFYNDESPRKLTGRVASRSGSPSNRARLARLHQTGQLRDLLYTRLQLEGVISQRDVARKGGEVREVVERELRRVSELESIKALPLPGRFDPGLRPGSAPTRLATPDLKHALSTAGTISTLFLPLAVAAPPHSRVDR